MNRGLFLVTLGAIYSHLLLASDKPNQEEAINRMQQAVAKTNIFALPSFVMKAMVEVENRHKTLEGTYELWWNGPDQWREEIRLPGYNEVQVGAKGTVWVQRNTDFILLPVYHMRRALGFGSNVASTPTSSLLRLDSARKVVKKQRDKKEHGKNLTCFEMEDETKHASEVCLDNGTGTIANNSAFHVEDELQPIGEKVFPRVLSSIENGKTLAKVNISEFTSPARFAQNVFTPPDGVAPQEACMNPTTPSVTQKVSPTYPEGARAGRIQGVVRFDTLIGVDGIPQIRRTLEAPSTDLEASARQAVEKWRYDPASCNDHPVAASILVQVNYTLSY